MNTSVFDVLGPVMIGPSSSHTAGACRLGLMARKILQDEPVQATVFLHESFQKTRYGHGTEVAILGGILGIAPDNEQLNEAKEIAKSKQVSFLFQEKDLKGEHPNSCQINLTAPDGNQVTIVGSSLGGGLIQISQVDDFNVKLSGQYHALITKHLDRPGLVFRITRYLSDQEINIAYMQVSRTRKGDTASLILETDDPISESIKDNLTQDDDIEQARIIQPL
ncbi:L-serine ammonia-lyase, iron-sulfur-dependent subunit beta [Natranaerobius thermophilus]|uniref:L-serine deaminase n=1 Tax=Natranaerobius thermophilus (strain ATCC BAA-1301 / DSM 18059 / JW/NM-WN-LF) TaxID=457570 RepID=B2A3H1_NATTJ|nr:L-serine ammonia-lyase, iron-sulfur-dependent subunit beta [Natranaerobius thermophilus]ACB86400.1 L-serine dehydratase, iron-sulfur-dependent, beta subunit [Natranaerobius thermophilus JW/NM-WN-LF]